MASVRSGTVTVVTPGTPVALSTTRKTCAWVVVQNKKGNTGQMYVGGAGGKTATPFSSNTVGIDPNGSITMPALGVCDSYNLADILVDHDTGGSAILFTFGLA